MDREYRLAPVGGRRTLPRKCAFAPEDRSLTVAALIEAATLRARSSSFVATPPGCHAKLFHQAAHHLEHVAMSQHRRRFALHDFEIAAGEADAFFRRGQQPTRLGDEPLRILFG